MSRFRMQRMEYRLVSRVGDPELIHVFMPKGPYRGMSVDLISPLGNVMVTGITDWGAPPNEEHIKAELPISQATIDDAGWQIRVGEYRFHVLPRKGQNLFIFLEHRDDKVPVSASEQWFMDRMTMLETQVDNNEAAILELREHINALGEHVGRLMNTETDSLLKHHIEQHDGLTKRIDALEVHVRRLRKKELGGAEPGM